MSLQETIQQHVKDALRSHDELRLLVLRSLLASVHNRVLEKRARGGNVELSEEEMVAVLRSEVKKRHDAIQEFEKGGRNDLVKRESDECLILESYLPPELSDEQIARIIQTIGGENVTHSRKDFGRLMGEVMKQVSSRASGERVSRLLNQYLDS